MKEGYREEPSEVVQRRGTARTGVHRAVESLLQSFGEEALVAQPQPRTQPEILGEAVMLDTSGIEEVAEAPVEQTPDNVIVGRFPLQNAVRVVNPEQAEAGAQDVQAA